MNREGRIFDSESIHEFTRAGAPADCWEDRIYRPKTLAKIFDVNRATLDLWVKKGFLPKPLKFNEAQRCLGWKRSDIREVFNNLQRVRI